MPPRRVTVCATPGCPELATRRGKCDTHATPAWAGSTRGGSTRATRRLRAQVLAEEPTCRDCGGVATEAGHIIPAAYGGTYERHNLKGQCRACNVQQIADDKRRYGSG